MTQSSTYSGIILHNASLAIDGDNRTTQRFCSHTDVNHTKAWFQVDLGGQYSIKSVKIFYRKEGAFFVVVFLDVSFFTVVKIRAVFHFHGMYVSTKNKSFI